MLRLYCRAGGSNEIQLLKPAGTAPHLKRVRQEAIAFGKENGPREALDILEKYPFELWEGTNGFGDPFELLYLRTNSNVYEELAEHVSPQWAWRYTGLAEMFERYGRPIRFIAIEADEKFDTMADVPDPAFDAASDVVNRAFNDIAVLIGTQGPISCIDRYHTMLHGYMKEVCRKAGIEFRDSADVVALYKRIEENHPAFSVRVTGEHQIRTIMQSLVSTVDALNPVRNDRSMAHATDALLKESEAMLVVNAVKTIMNYLTSRLHDKGFS